MRRRTLLAASAGAAALAGATPIPASAVQGSDVTVSLLSGPAAATPARLQAFAVQGSDVTVSLLPGPAATVLLYVARRFHYEIDTLRAGEVTAGGSGTILDIRPGWYPAGARDGFLPHQLTVLRDILAECDGLVRWGGDAADSPREGRFEIAVRAADRRLRTLAERLDGDAASPSRRVGAETALPFTPARLKRAESLRRRS